jgi:hypothetical protein
MSPEEIRVRSLYLFLACSRAIEEGSGRLKATVPDSMPAVKSALDKAVKKELALVFRYWATRKIWERLESRELEAKELNLAVLRLFFEGFRLPKDGSGMRYAELSTVSDEAREVSHRLANALGVEHPPLAREIERALLPWRDAVLQYTTEALSRSVEELSRAIKEWT